LNTTPSSQSTERGKITAILSVVELATYIIGACIATYRPLFSDINKRISTSMAKSKHSSKSSWGDKSMDLSSMTPQRTQDGKNGSLSYWENVDLELLQDPEMAKLREERGANQLQEVQNKEFRGSW
jgi:hypothetical protein